MNRRSSGYNYDWSSNLHGGRTPGTELVSTALDLFLWVLSDGERCNPLLCFTLPNCQGWCFNTWITFIPVGH